MRVVNPPGLDFVHLVEHVAKIALGVDPSAVHARHDFADDFLPGCGVGSVPQLLEMREQADVDEIGERRLRPFLQLLPFWGIRRGPVVPPVGRFERAAEIRPHRPGLALLHLFALIKNSEKKNPCQFGNILHGSRTIRSAQNVTDAPDRLVEGRLGGEGFCGHDAQSASSGLKPMARKCLSAVSASVSPCSRMRTNEVQSVSGNPWSRRSLHNRVADSN